MLFEKLQKPLQRQLSRLGLGPQAAKGLAFALGLAIIGTIGYFLYNFLMKKDKAAPPAPAAPDAGEEKHDHEDKPEVRMAACHKQGLSLCDAVCPDGGRCNPFAPTGDGCICDHAQCPATQL